MGGYSVEGWFVAFRATTTANTTATPRDSSWQCFPTVYSLFLTPSHGLSFPPTLYFTLSFSLYLFSYLHLSLSLFNFIRHFGDLSLPLLFSVVRRHGCVFSTFFRSAPSEVVASSTPPTRAHAPYRSLSRALPAIVPQRQLSFGTSGASCQTGRSPKSP